MHFQGMNSLSLVNIRRNEIHIVGEEAETTGRCELSEENGVQGLAFRKIFHDHSV